MIPSALLGSAVSCWAVDPTNSDVLAFGITLLTAGLISDLAGWSMLSTAVIVLVAGFLIGDEVLNLIDVELDTLVVSMLAELVLFSTLVTDGMCVGLHDHVGAHTSR